MSIEGGVSAPWYAASLWAYLSISAHDRVCPARSLTTAKEAST